MTPHPLAVSLYDAINAVRETISKAYPHDWDVATFQAYSHSAFKLDWSFPETSSSHEKMAFEAARIQLMQNFHDMNQLIAEIFALISPNDAGGNIGKMEATFSSHDNIHVLWQWSARAMGFDNTRYLDQFFFFKFSERNFDNDFITHISAMLNRGRHDHLWRADIVEEKRNIEVPLAHYNFFAQDEARANDFANTLALSVRQFAFSKPVIKIENQE